MCFSNYLSAKAGNEEQAKKDKEVEARQIYTKIAGPSGEFATKEAASFGVNQLRIGGGYPGVSPVKAPTFSPLFGSPSVPQLTKPPALTLGNGGRPMPSDFLR